MIDFRNITSSKFFIPVIVLVVILLIGFFSFGNSGVETDTQRIQRLSESFACPSCGGQSVAESTSSASSNIMKVIQSEVNAGSTDLEIRNILVEDWGEEILLNPPSQGLSLFVWLIPILFFLFSVFIVVYLIRSDVIFSDKKRNFSDLFTQKGKVLLILGLGSFFVVIVSLVLSNFMGERDVGDSLTGSIDQTNSDKLLECQNSANTGQILESIQCIDKLINLEPDNAVYIANRGWFNALAARAASRVSSEDVDFLYEVSLTSLNKSLEIKPDGNDALAWRAIVYSDLNQMDKACKDINALKQNNAPDFLLGLVSRISSQCK